MRGFSNGSHLSNVVEVSVGGGLLGQELAVRVQHEVQVELLQKAKRVKDNK